LETAINDENPFQKGKTRRFVTFIWGLSGHHFIKNKHQSSKSAF
jgi:hypothetical protein